MLYQLSEQQVKNLVSFLQRVDLKGNEAVALVSIFQSLSSPQKEKLDKVDKGDKIQSEVK